MTAKRESLALVERRAFFVFRPTTFALVAGLRSDENRLALHDIPLPVKLLQRCLALPCCFCLMKTLLWGFQSQQFQSTVTFVYMSILSFWKNLVTFQA
ncbi:hypothetical protein EDS67_21410 [candidate division KSB1 bacterium]|nr:MAG: hypothetical protein EDS67_21410 [candidate division KSB1 bacterium]MBC6952300.1 hypothetical protein [candidate division KSB1 bacterium]MCE7943653.1 hypothetical protein [Chlorobi bacterium CHB1]RIK53114.1 MAG: hypothetical protein DCC62_32535 [candidate division KSB1 bacterium]